MKYQTFYPSLELSNTVKCFWVFEGSASISNPYKLRTLASGFPELLFHYRGIFKEIGSDDKPFESFHAGVHGQTNKYRNFEITEDFGMFGVQLFPYVVESLFGISSEEMKDELPDLNMLKSFRNSDLEFQMLSATDTQERIAIISKFILNNSIQPPKPSLVYAVNKIIKANGNLDFNVICDEVSLSQRQFERVFKEGVGFSAKHFARIVRFSHVLKNYNETMSLTELALKFGYFDQSHFNNEFKEFSGNTPTAYFAKLNF